jgi:amino acid adenylation domain-containing protein
MLDRDFSDVVAAKGSTKERQYWTNKLAGHPAKSIFPYDHNPPIPDTNRQQEPPGRTGELRLTGQLFSRIQWITNESDARLHMILVAGVTLLTRFYTGNTDILLGTSIYKQHTEGDFINTVLVLRNRVESHMCFKELLFQVKDTLTGALEHQNYPVKALLYDMKIPFSAGDFPLFDIAVLLENIQERSYFKTITPRVLFSFSRQEDHIDCTVEYDGSLYEEATIRRILTHFEHILREVIFQVDVPLSGIEMLPPRERQQLLVEFNGAAAEIPARQTIHGLFTDQVERTPHHTALVGANCVEPVSYKELNERANHLARVLREKGVNGGTIVGIFMERSLEMIAGILAVLKAGGAYLPVEILYPRDRIAYMLQNSGVCLLLSGQEPPGGDIPAMEIIAVNQLPPNRQHPQKTGNLNRSVKSTDPAYVIYTSGTTGRPKGVIVEHRSAVNTLMYRKDSYKLSGSDTALQLFSYAFDGFVTSFFTPIISGAKVVLLKEEEARDMVRITGAIVQHGVTHLIGIPALYKSIIEMLTPEQAALLRIITLAGDSLSPAVLELTRKKNPAIEIVNEYGVTEAAVMSTIYRNQEKYPEIKIGKPIWNTRLYILDPRRQPQGIGIPGELCIAGAGVARGYLNNPRLTEERFIPDPFVKGERMYRSGDIGKWRPDGNIVLYGRSDRQVKIRGYRIELDEIENQLVRYEHVKEAVIIEKKEGGYEYLCAYVVPGSGDIKLEVPDLREYLAEKLPDYMIPAYFTALERIPLTPNGKIDRNALPEPEVITEKEYAAPRDTLEKILAATWAEVLDLEKETIGIHDNFFELGGHSLNATILLLKIHEILQVKVSLADLFGFPTIADLARHVQGTGKVRFSPIQPVELKEYYPLSAAQKRLYILKGLAPRSIGYNVPTRLVIEGVFEWEKFAETFKQLIRRQESLRTSFEMVDGEPVQVIHEEVVFKVEHLGSGPGPVVENFVRPFELSQAPLLRVGVIEEEKQKHILMVDMHHIITDGLSMGILVRDFIALFQGAGPAPLKIRYRDFSQWQTREKEKGVLKDQEDFWLREFKEEPPLLNLPYDYTRPLVQRFEGSVVPFEIPAGELEKLNLLAREENATRFMVILAMFDILLWRLGDQEEITVGTPVMGRRHANLEPVIGVFINNLALRNHLPATASFKEFLKHVKTRTIEASENQDYPFEELVDRVVVNRDLGRNPLFDVMFDYKEDFSGITGVEIPGLRLALADSKTFTAKFDLTLKCSEAGDNLAFSFEYSTNLFKESTILRFIGYFKKWSLIF